MTTEQAMAFGLMAVTVAFFVWGRFRYDLVALAALFVGVLLGLVPIENMFSGFASDLVWIVGSALIVSAAVARSGVIERFMRPLLGPLRTADSQAPAFVGMTTALSMVTKNIGALAIAMPVALQHARRTGVSPSRLLMPMAFASLLGGMVTLVGTSPNIVVSSVRQEITGQPFLMFDFAPVGLGLCLLGVVFLSLAPRFVKLERPCPPSIDAAFTLERYVTEIEIGEESLGGKPTILALRALCKDDVRVLAVLDKDKKRLPALADRTLDPGDRLLIEGEAEDLERVVAEATVRLAGERHRSEEPLDADVAIVEAIVREDSPLVGRTAAQARLHEWYGLSLLAVSRGGARTVEQLSDFALRAGDVVLLKAERGALAEALGELRVLPLSERGVALGQPRRVWAPIVTLAVAMGLVGFGVAPVALAFFGAAVVLLALRVMSLDDAYRAIDGPLLVLLGALIPVSETIRATGGDRLIGDLIADAIRATPPTVAIGALIAFAMAVTPFLNNAATVLILAPVAAGVAANLKLNPDPFLMAIAVGAACDFLTPIGHQCNALVMTPGGYAFSDYWRLGLPLSFLVIVVGAPLILLFWPMS